MKDLLELAIKASLLAGKEILKVYHTNFDVEQKRDDSPLTLADKNAHHKIVETLGDIYPILSEEGKQTPYEERKKWDTLWLVDPLDGTKEFIKKNGEFTVNIALIKQGKPVMGVIYVPVKKCLYLGEISMGAFKYDNIENYEQFDCTHFKKLPLETPKVFTVVGSRSHMSQETQEYFNQLKQQHQQVEIISVGSSLKLCMVAEGKANEYPRFAPTMEWDTAAGHAIVSSMGGGVLLHQSQQQLVYNKENLLNPWFLVK